MTNEEAIEVLKGMLDSGLYTSHDPFWTAGKMAIKALRKQTPRTPDSSYDGYADGYPVYDYFCPSCGREVDDTDHHCTCGQTIDWDFIE